MPGVTKYNLVDDAHDLRIPMHNDEVFKHGVCFEAKVRSLRNRYFSGQGRNSVEARGACGTLCVTAAAPCAHPHVTEDSSRLTSLCVTLTAFVI